VAGGRGPQSVRDLDRWVAENVLSRFSPLFREARYLLLLGDFGVRGELLDQGGQVGAFDVGEATAEVAGKDLAASQ
jgi:hypothetical protein